MELKEKQCTKCKITKPLTLEYFRKRKSSRDGFRNECKTCLIEYSKKWREDNPEYGEDYRRNNKEKIAKYQKKYDKKYYVKNKEKIDDKNKKHYEENKEQYQENGRKWRLRNKEKISKMQKEWAEKNKDYLKTYSKKYREENGDYLREQTRMWRQKNRHIDNQYSKDRKMKMEKLEKTLTLEEWTQTLIYFDFKCAYCGITQDQHLTSVGQNLHQDHLIPLTKMGGFTKENIIPSCRDCNSSKRNHKFEEWYRASDNYNSDYEAKILSFVSNFQR